MKRNYLLLVALLILGVILVPVASADAATASTRPQRAEVRYLEGMMDHHQMAVDMSHDCLKKAKTEAVTTICHNIIDAQTKEIRQLHDWLLSWYQVDYNPMPMQHMMDMMGQTHSGSMMDGQHMGGMMSNGMMNSGMNNGMMNGTADPGSMMASTAAPGHMGGMQMPDDMPMMMGMMAGLSNLQGKEYEVAWLEAMIDHHDDGVHMSQRLLKHVEHKELGDFAHKVIDDQSKEIQAMETLLSTLGK